MDRTRIYGNRDTVLCVKTTVEITDALAQEVRELAAREKVPVRELIEDGLRKVLEERRGSQEFRLRDASFDGQGLQPEFRGAGWERLRSAAYQGRGG